MIQAETFNQQDINHAFFTRRGGVSEGLFDSLNFSIKYGDPIENVIQNQKIAAAMMNRGDNDIVLAKQIHSNIAHIVDKKPKDPIIADALVTNNPGLIIGVLTADCVPVLLADKKRHIIAAVHAGWRGAAAGILKNTLSVMIELGANPSNIQAAIGPCIFQESYEVQDDVKSHFLMALHRFQDSENPGKYYFDLPGIIEDQLAEIGIPFIENVQQNTYTNENQFFSCRRSFHRNEKGFGCQLSAISL